MKYSSNRSFRQALEDRLKTNYPHYQIPRLRKMITFERFMARLDDHWILKGGYALQLRTDSARTTQDIDLLALNIPPDQIQESLFEIIHRDLGDFFDFVVERSSQSFISGSVIRFKVTAKLAGRNFEQFHIDIGFGDPIVELVEYLEPPQYLDFAEIPITRIPCYPATQHIAEKVHALTRPRMTENSRVKDLVDILLFACMDIHLGAGALFNAIQAVFMARGDVIPSQLKPFPSDWKSKYSQFTKNTAIPFSHYDDAVQAAHLFIDPVLSGKNHGTWDSINWKWEDD